MFYMKQTNLLFYTTSYSAQKPTNQPNRDLQILDYVKNIFRQVIFVKICFAHKYTYSGTISYQPIFRNISLERK